MPADFSAMLENAGTPEERKAAAMTVAARINTHCAATRHTTAEWLITAVRATATVWIGVEMCARRGIIKVYDPRPGAHTATRLTVMWQAVMHQLHNKYLAVEYARCTSRVCPASAQQGRGTDDARSTALAVLHSLHTATLQQEDTHNLAKYSTADGGCTAVALH